MRRCSVLLVVLIVLSYVALMIASIPNVPTGTWKAWNSMSSARSGATAVLLSDGRVLIAGGSDNNGTVNSVDLFGTDGRFSSAQAMNMPRSSYAATLLQDGRVLVTGGITNGGGITNSAEMYDPSADTWTLLSSVMVDPRSGHTASLLQDGRLLLAGGQNSGGAVSSLEIFDPANSSFTSAGVMSSPRMNHAASVLADGRVLIVGGSDGTNPLNTSDIYDPGAGSVMAGPNLSIPRASVSATGTLDGKIVVIGGNNGSNDLASAEIYDPASGQFSPSGSALSTARSGHRSFLLPKNNGILVVGGSSSGTDLSSAELYYPWADAFQPTGAMSVARPGFTGSPLTLEGRFLAAGGTGLSSTELYGFATVKTDAADYPPGSTVNITGSGWQPGETVTLTLVEVPYYDTPGPYTAVADSSGNISNSSFVTDEHDVSTQFYLTAVGSNSGVQAQNTFTDANEHFNNPLESDCSTPAPKVGGVAQFNFGQTVCMPAAGLNNGSSYQVQWFAPGSGTPTFSDTFNNVTGGSLTVSHQPTATGTWTVKLLSSPGGTPLNTATFNVTNTHATTTTLSCTPSSVAVNAPTSCAATVSDIAPSGATTPTGSVSFSSSGSGTFNPASCTLSGSGSTASCSSTYTPTVIGTGTHTIAGSYPGNSSFAASSGTFAVLVGKRSTSSVVSCSPNPDNLNNATTCTATVSDTDAGTKSTPTGTVSFSSSGAGNFSAASCTLSSGSCSVTYTPTALGTGTHTITGSYNGDTTHSTSSGTFAVIVNATTTTTVASSPNPSIYGSSVTFTATISPSVGSNGTVDFEDGASVVCSAVAVSGSSATCSTSTLSAGSHSTITAVFSGGGGFAGSTSSSFTQNVSQKTLSVAGVTASNKIYDGTNTASVSGTAALLSPEAFGTGTGTDGKPYNGDVVSVTGTPSGTFANKDAASGINITVSGLTLAGAQASNYTLTAPTLSANITPKALAYSGLSVPTSKVYDGTTAAVVSGTAALLTAEAAGAGNTGDGKPYTVDSVSVTGTPTATYNSKDVATATTVTFAGVSLTGTGNANYTLTNLTQAATITPKPLTISGVIASNKTYDGSTTATLSGTAALNGVVSGDIVVLNSPGVSALFADKNVGMNKPVTVSGYTIGGTDSGNYTVSQPTGLTANITALHITGSFTASNKTYDGTTSAMVVTRSLSGTISGDAISLTGGIATFADKNVGAGKTVTLTGASLSGADAGNYVLDSVATTTADITALHITGSFTANNKVYDGNTSATAGTRSLTGTISGDNVSLTGGTATFADKNVGVGKTVTLTGASLTGTDASNYVLDSVATTIASISPRDLHVTATADGKQYDGNTTAVAHLNDDRVSGDMLNDNYSSALFSDKNVGTGKTVTVSGITISGTDAGNYSLANNTTTTTANILQRDLHVTAAADNKQYDGNTTAVAHLSDDRVSGDVMSDSYTSALFSDKNVGTGKTVTVSGISISGTDAGNYSLANTSTTTTATINARDLHVTATADSKQYDGTTTAVAHLSDDRVSGDVFSDNYGTASFSDKNAGTGKTVSVNGISISGPDAGNYTFNASTSAIADITPRPLLITATGVNKEYDGTAAATVTLSDNRVAGDTFTDTYSSATFADKNVGTAKAVSVAGITTSGTDAVNYSFNMTASATADITPRPLTVTATGVNKQYDGTTAASVTLSDNRVGGDSLADSYTAATFSDKNVGTGKTVNATGISISGTDAGNYALANNSTTTTANITARNLHVTATADNKQYDGNTNAVAQLADDRVTGDVFTDMYTSASFSDRNVGGGKTVTVNGIAISGTDAGNYALVNTSATATANITASPLTVTAIADSKTYDGTASSAATPLISGSIAPGDAPGFTQSFDSKDAGPRTLVPAGSMNDGNGGNNYAVTFKSAPGTINPKPIAITVNSGQNKVYGTPDPTLTYLSTGLITGDSFTGSLSRVPGENAGGYAISQGTLTAGPNYFISFVGSTFTITQAASAISLISSVTPSVFGQTVMFTATVIDNSPGSVGTPTGNVQFYIDGSPFGGAASLSGGKAVLTTSSLSVSTHPVYAVYAGDLNFIGSTTATINQVVGKDSTTMTVTSSLPTSTLNQSVKYTATVTAAPPGSGTPTGSVTFYVDSTGGLLLGSATLSGGTASLSSSAVPVNSHLIIAVYSGDANFTTSSGSVSELVQYATGGMCDGDLGHQILQPINATGTISVFKLGSTVPTKFRVCDANGVSIGTPGVVTAYGLLNAASSPNVTVDEDVYSTTPDTAFRWDTTGQQWIFNQSTKNNPSLNHTNTMYYFGISLNDGTWIYFQYALK